MNIVVYLFRDIKEWHGHDLPDFSEKPATCVWDPCALELLFKQDKITAISGKIFPGFKHNPKKIEILFEMVRLYDHHNIPSGAFYNSCKPILTGLQLEYLDDLIQQYRAKKAAKLAEEMDTLAKEIQAKTKNQKYIVTTDAFKEMFEAYAAEELKKEIDKQILNEIYGKQKTDSAG